MADDGKIKYFLVSPGSDAEKSPRPFYWSVDNGDNWIGIARGIWRPKTNNDVVKEVVEAEDLTDLDWKKTPFQNNSLISGWLSRSGEFFGCPSKFHDIVAYCVLGTKVAELEKRGWVRIHDSNWFVCEHRLSAEQRNWLSMNGYKVLDSF